MASVVELINKAGARLKKIIDRQKAGKSIGADDIEWLSYYPNRTAGKGENQFTTFAWTVYRASLEFGLDWNTLAKRLTQAGEKADANGCFTTAQIVRAIYSNYEHERIRKTKAEADQVEMENAKMRGELVDVETFAKKWDHVFIKLKQAIKSSSLPESSQVQLLGELEKVLKG